MDLKVKSKNVALVINARKESPKPLQDLEQTQKALNSIENAFVSSIIHDKDLLENGEQKTIHLHAYIELPQKQTLKAILTLLSVSLNIPIDLVSIEATNNDYLIIQYLTHKNDKSKTQYSLECVSTNNEQLMLERWNKVYQTEEQIRLEILKCCPDRELIDLVQTYGYNQINSMRGMIKDIKAENKSPNKDIERKLSNLKSEVNDLRELYEDLVENLRQNLTQEQTSRIDLKHSLDYYQKLIEFYDNR